MRPSRLRAGVEIRCATVMEPGRATASTHFHDIGSRSSRDRRMAMRRASWPSAAVGNGPNDHPPSRIDAVASDAGIGIGRAHVATPVHHPHLEFRLLHAHNNILQLEY